MIEQRLIGICPDPYERDPEVICSGCIMPVDTGMPLYEGEVWEDSAVPYCSRCERDLVGLRASESGGRRHPGYQSIYDTYSFPALRLARQKKWPGDWRETATLPS